jgi:hypothetical protein
VSLFQIGAAELQELADGRLAIVATPGLVALDPASLLVLEPNQGVLRRAGAPGTTPEGAALPMPRGFHPLAILAPGAEAASSLAAGLPAGIPRLIGPDPLPALVARLAEALAAASSTRQQAANRLEAGGQPALPAGQPADATVALTPAEADFQDLKLYQHTINADGSYRHLDLGLVGLTSAAGIWREARLKVFDRRGTIGLEIRNIRGWPGIFDVWPEGGSDRFGLFWRLETQDVAKSVARLATVQNGAAISALLGALPAAVRQAAILAELPEAEQEAWVARSHALAAAVATAMQPDSPTGPPPAS